jgi:hypothetical protein
MDNPLLVRRFQRLGDLLRDRQCVVYWNAVGPHPHRLPSAFAKATARPRRSSKSGGGRLAVARRAASKQLAAWSGTSPLDDFGERRPIDQLHHERLNPIRLLEAVDDRDVRVIQCSERFGFTLETREPLRIMREGLGQDLDRNGTIEFRIARTVDLTHTAGA